MDLANVLAKVSIPSSSGQWCQRDCLAAEQADVQEFQSLLHQVSGANVESTYFAVKRIPVSIPSSSGQWCQRSGSSIVQAGTVKFQSLLHQVSGANREL